MDLIISPTAIKPKGVKAVREAIPTLNSHDHKPHEICAVYLLKNNKTVLKLATYSISSL